MIKNRRHFNKNLYKKNDLYRRAIDGLEQNIRKKAARDMLTVLMESLPEMLLQVLFIVLEKSKDVCTFGGEDLSMTSGIDLIYFSIAMSSFNIFLTLLTA